MDGLVHVHKCAHRVVVVVMGGGGVQLLYMVECERSLVYTYLVCTEPTCMYVCRNTVCVVHEYSVCCTHTGAARMHAVVEYIATCSHMCTQPV